MKPGCLCGSYVGPLCGPPLRWWVLCGALPSVCVPCFGPLCGSPVRVPSVWVPSVWVPCVGPLCGSLVALRPCGIYSRDVSRSFTRSRSPDTLNPGGGNEYRLAFTRYSFTSSRLCTNQCMALFARSAKSTHFLAEREENRLKIQYYNWTPRISPLDKWQHDWIASGVF